VSRLSIFAVILSLLAEASRVSAQQSVVRFEPTASASFRQLANLGAVTDAVSDGEGRIVILDGPNDRVVVTDEHLGVLATYGTRGAGVGQFIEPIALARLGPGRVAILDRGLRHVTVLLLKQRGKVLTQERTVPLEVRASAICGLGSDHLLIYGMKGGFRLHVIDLGGHVLRSFAPGDKRFSKMAQTILAQGKVSCESGHDVALLSSEYLSRVEAFRITSGRLGWVDTLSPFRATRMIDRDTSVTVSSGNSGFSLISSMLDGAKYRVFQTVFDARRDNATVDTVTTYTYSATEKKWLAYTYDVPRIVPLTDTHVIAVRTGASSGIAVGRLSVVASVAAPSNRGQRQ
jgi:hypothetical protein